MLTLTKRRSASRRCANSARTSRRVEGKASALSLYAGMALRYARMAVATLWYYSAYDRQEERLMYCPNCAAQIEETQKYCRSCGTDVSLVSQALRANCPVGAPLEYTWDTAGA